MEQQREEDTRGSVTRYDGGGESSGTKDTSIYIYIYIHTISQRCAVIVLCLCVTFHAEGPHRTCRADARVATFFRSGFPRTTESPLSLAEGIRVETLVSLYSCARRRGTLDIVVATLATLCRIVCTHHRSSSRAISADFLLPIA